VADKPARGWEKERLSDATFWADGTLTRHAYWGGPQAWWWRRAGWKRALSKSLTTVVCTVVTWGMFAHRPGTERVTAVVSGAAAGCALVRFLLWLEIRKHNRDVVRPLHSALSGIFDAPRPPKIPLDYATNRAAEILLYPPKDFTGGDRDRDDIARALEAKLPRLDSPEIDWSRLHSHKPRIPVRHSAPPPGKVTWAQIEPAVRAAGAAELIVGVGRKQQVTKVSIELDSPHFGISMGTGGGKSNLASFWLVQALMRGDIVLILDAKHFSHPWAFKDMDAEYGLLPNVGYARWIPDLHDAMVWLGQELSRRTLQAERIINAKGDLLGDVGPRLWIVAEEMNLATPLLKQHWADVRDPEQVKKSPALTGLGAVAFAGRAVKMHLIVIGQQLTAETLGGGSVRENIGVRCLARYTQNTWKMQAGDVPMPPSPSVPGRVQCIASGGVSETQVPLMDLEQVRELALSGTVTACPAGMPGITRGGAHPAQVAVPGFAAIEMGPDQPGVIGLTLAEAIAEGILRRSIVSARKEAQRPGFPAPLGEPRQGVASRYRPSELGDWEKERAGR
jgi:hypothetical protein